MAVSAWIKYGHCGESLFRLTPRNLPSATYCVDLQTLHRIAGGILVGGRHWEEHSQVVVALQVDGQRLVQGFSHGRGRRPFTAPQETLRNGLRVL